jgi:outer membrane protein OmpA-like peptidoglycan-associated protein
MKKLIIIILTITSTSLSAQGIHRGIAWGADRDTLKYIIASPFDNWHINVALGIQTFIGNTPDADAQWNSADWSLRAEVGKWILPDFAISLRLGFASVHSQSIHGGNNPWTDISNPIHYAGVANTYYPIKAHALTMMGIVTLDWTNFFLGYESGKQRKWHICTPVGLGLACLLGDIDNPNYVTKVNNNLGPDDDPIALGDMSRNFELGFTAGLSTEYYVSRHVSLNAALELFFARGSIDDYNYNLDEDMRRVDFIPSFHIGAKFNLLSHIRKFHPDTKKVSVDSVYHEFLAFGSSNTVKILNGKIERLMSERDSIADNMAVLADNDKAKMGMDSLLIDSINRQLGDLQEMLSHYRPDLPGNGYNGDHRPNTLIDELMDINNVLRLPSTVVYFELDKYYLDYNARKKLQDFANEANSLDDTIEFYMIGAADSLTGSIKHNQWLSEQRCGAAHQMLVKNFGMSENQLIRVHAGGINDYTPQENNRMVLVIQRTPVTEEIVDRWIRMSKERLNKNSRR